MNPTPKGTNYFIILFVISILLVGRLLWPFLSILIFSFLLAGIFQPVYSYFKRRLSPTLASLTTCMIIIILVFVPLTFFVGALSQEAFALYQAGKSANIATRLLEFIRNNAYIVRFQDFLGSHGIVIKPEGVIQTLSDVTRALGLFLYNHASAWAANILSFIFDFFMMIITIFFLLIDHERLIHFLLRLSPLSEEQGRSLIKKFEEIAWAVLIGNGISGVFQGLLGGVAFVILNMGSPILWGAVMAILAFLPIFGIGLVLIPASLLLMIKGRITAGIILVIFYLVLSFSVEYAIKPKLVGQQVKMHTLLVFLSIIGGLSVFGFLGIIYGPLIITLFLTLSEIYLRQYDQVVNGADGKNRAE